MRPCATSNWYPDGIAGQRSVSVLDVLETNCTCGAARFATVIVCWHVLELPHGSAATHVRVMATAFVPALFVTVLSTLTVAELHASLALGVSKLHACAPDTVRLELHVITGGVRSRTVIR